MLLNLLYIACNKCVLIFLLTFYYKMTRLRILKILKDIRPEFNFKNNNDYFKSGLLDSLDIVILVECLEKEFKIKISGEEVIPKNFSNLKKIVNFIKKK